MLALGYLTRYAGVDATLGLAFAATGVLYPFFGTLLGWLGVAVTGSDTASNVLFGGLQKVTSQQLGLSPVLMAGANSAGGVMGKMIDAQSIVVASTATRWFGQEGTDTALRVPAQPGAGGAGGAGGHADGLRAAVHAARSGLTVPVPGRHLHGRHQGAARNPARALRAVRARGHASLRMRWPDADTADSDGGGVAGEPAAAASTCCDSAMPTRCPSCRAAPAPDWRAARCRIRRACCCRWRSSIAS